MVEGGAGKRVEDVGSRDGIECVLDVEGDDDGGLLGLSLGCCDRRP